MYCLDVDAVRGFISDKKTNFPFLLSVIGDGISSDCVAS